MISSCSDCTTKCCRSGVGPYRTVSSTDWLSMKQKGSERYNTKCEHYDDKKGKCLVWDRAPYVCKVYVCGIRTYTDKELSSIDRVIKQHEAGMKNEGLLYG